MSRTPLHTWAPLLAVLFVAIFAVAQDPPPAEEPPPAAPLDIRQVQVQVWISETNEQGLRELGANLQFRRFAGAEELPGSVQQVQTNLFNPETDFGRVTLPAPSANPPSPPFDPVVQNPDFANPPNRPDESGAPGLQTREGLGLTTSIIDPEYGTIDGVFRAIETKTDVDLISKPELLVVNQVAAEIKAGGQVPYQTVKYDKGNPQLSVAWRDIGVNLKLTPTILPNDFVQLNIEQLDVSDNTRIENLRGVDLPVFSKRSQTGFVHVPNGQTLVVGGLSSRVVRKAQRRIPLIGRIPVLGIPFRSQQSEADITHLLIFVSPTVVNLRNMTDRAESAVRFWEGRGSEWMNVERIETEIEAMESEL